MTTTTEPVIIPRGMLLAAAALLCVVTLTAGLAHRYKQPTPLPSGPAIASRDFRFADRADRGVDIRDGETGALVETVAPKSGGFLRGVMRALLYEVRSDARRSAGDEDHLFRLTEWPDGRLSLRDLATEQAIELEAFGPTNRDVFARLLKPGSASKGQDR